MNLIRVNKNTINWSFIIFSGIFVAFFLNFFQPFGISNNNYSLKGLLLISGYGFITSLCILIIEIVSYKIKAITAKKYGLAWLILSILAISICSLLYYTIIFEAKPIIYNSLLVWVTNVALVGLFVLVFWRTIETYQFRSIFIDKKRNLSIPSKYKSDGVLCISPEQLLVVESAGNYVIIYYLKNNFVTKKMIRNSMKNIELLTAKFEKLVRCHQSFLINTEHVKSYNSKNGNYKITLENFLKDIPVSRKLWKEVKKQIAVNIGQNLN